MSDLFFGDTLTEILRLCGVGDREIAVSSEYERFYLLADAAPLLAGHPFLSAVCENLRAVTGREEIRLSGADAPALWRECAERLPFCDALPETPHSPQPACRIPLPEQVDLPVIPETVLLPTETDRGAWAERLLTLLSEREDAYAECRILPSSRAVRPDLYHLGEALRAEFRTEEQNDLILAQLIRELSLGGGKLLLRFRCGAEEAIRWMDLADGYGCGERIVTSDRADVRDALVSRIARTPAGIPARLALCAGEFPDADARRREAVRLSRFYPSGRLLFLP